ISDILFHRQLQQFQSTLPTKGSDFELVLSYLDTYNFNPRSPLKGATLAISFHSPLPKFQSTLPTKGSDGTEVSSCSSIVNFNPRSPLKGATIATRVSTGDECDFNPRSPLK